jgi:uncharacterized SAM-binding protein YcdF (DUF218 family)
VTRIVAVLGYSARGGGDLHPICHARLARAQEIAESGDVVVLSGWSRRNGIESEADLMARAWRVPEVTLLRDRDARHTVQNAVRIAATAREVGADEVVVVTSAWHSPRAALLVRRALRDAGAVVSSVSVRSPLSLPLLARELACLVAIPAQLGIMRRQLR